MSDFGEPCFIGYLLSSVNLKNAFCHKSWYKKDRGYLKISSLSNNDRELLMWRSGVSKIIANAPDSVNKNHYNSICYHHHRELLMWRSGVRKIIANAPDSVNENHHNSICYHHHSMFLTCYEAKQKSVSTHLDCILIRGRKNNAKVNNIPFL